MPSEAELLSRLAGLDASRKGTREHVDLLNQLAGEIAFSESRRSYDLAREAEALSKALDYRKGVADSQTNQAYHYYQIGRHEQALEVSGRALEYYRQTDDLMGQGGVFSCYGLLYWTLGDYEKAIRYGRECIRLYETIGARENLAWGLTILGGIYADTGDHEQALALHARSLEMFRDLSDRIGEGRALTGMGNVYQAQGRHELALEQHEESLELFRGVGSKLSEARALNDIGVILQAKGDLEKALDCHLEALRLRRELSNHPAETTSLINLGRLYNQKQDPRAALQYLEPALRLAAEFSARPKVYQAHEALSHAYALAGEHEKALEHHREFHRVKEQVAGEESTTRLKNLEIRHGIEKAEQEAEIARLRHIELKQALDELKATQAQLVHTAKMASLGDLVAGLVHEIATPIGAIQASADVSRRSIEKLETVLTRISPDERRTVDALISSCQTILYASERIERLMRSLRSYAQLDQADFQLAHIHPGIEATLDLIAPKLGKRIETIKDFGDVPRIECYPSQLHQAFMTILVNAVESIEGQGTVTVKTWEEDGQVFVRITDTGRGLERGRLSRIFDVGFSEKDSRMGMHVGLSNVHHIVQNHGGSVEVESEPGRGTAFTIRLPPEQSHSRRNVRSEFGSLVPP
jgi:signal transduction histidine kinase